MKISSMVNPRNYPELRATLSGIHYPALVELKLDGELDWCVGQGGEVEPYFINKRGKVRTEMPILEAIKRRMDEKPFELVGELFHGQGENHALYALNSNRESDDLNFYPFDIISYENQSLVNQTLVDRKEIIASHLWDLIPARPIIVYSEKDVEKEFEKACKAGFEGIVIKNLNGRYITGACPWVKLKFSDQSDYVVTMIDPVKERIEIAVSSVTSTGAPLTRTVGAKCSHKQKASLRVGSLVTIEHHGLMEGGSLRNPVFIGVAKP